MKLPDRDIMKKTLQFIKPPKSGKGEMFLGQSPRALGSEFRLYMTVAVQENMQINTNSISLTLCQQGK